MLIKTSEGIVNVVALGSEALKAVWGLMPVRSATEGEMEEWQAMEGKVPEKMVLAVLPLRQSPGVAKLDFFTYDPLKVLVQRLQRFSGTTAQEVDRETLSELEELADGVRGMATDLRVAWEEGEARHWR
jgi:TolB-like protein